MLIPLPMKPTTLPAVTCSAPQMCDRQLPSPHPMLTPPLPLLFFHTLCCCHLSSWLFPRRPRTLPTLRVFALTVPFAQKALPKVFAWFQVPLKTQLWIGCPWPRFLKECPLLLLLSPPPFFFVALTYIMYRCIHLLIYYLAPPLDCKPEARHLVLFTAVSPVPSMGVQHLIDSVNTVK